MFDNFDGREWLCMSGIEKVIDELGWMILAKEVTIKSQQDEIEKLQRKIESIEQYIAVYEEFQKS